MKKYARLVISGNVQSVGYEVAVKQVAGCFQITGAIKKLGNKLEAYCQYENAENFHKFLDIIKIKRKPNTIDDIADLCEPHVRSIRVYEKGHPEYNDSGINFDEFDIHLGVKSTYEREMLEQLDIQLYLLDRSKRNVDKINGTLDSINNRLKKQLKKYKKRNF